MDGWAKSDGKMVDDSPCPYFLLDIMREREREHG